MQTCDTCSSQVAGNARFCRVCGAPVRQATSSPAVPPSSADGAEPAAPSSRRGFLPLIAAVVIAFGAVGGVGAYVVLRDRDATEVSPGPAAPSSGPEASTFGTDEPDERPASSVATGPAREESPVSDDWPDGRAGFTMALASMGDAGDAESAATRAREAGLDSGVLESSEYGSLTPGYWFVFAGTFGTALEARSAQRAARDAGFDDAYTTFVSREEPLPGDDAGSAPEGEARLQDQGWFTIEVPGDWPIVTNQVDYGVFKRSRWVHPDARGVKLTADSTRSVTRSPMELARQVRRQTSMSSGYEELSFGSTTRGGEDAASWHFRVGGVEKVDYFVNRCGGGVAVLGSTPAGSFDAHATAFLEAANSVTGTGC